MLHPQARALLDFIQANGVPPTHTLAPVDARRFYRERRRVTQPEPPEVASVQELQCTGPHGPIALRLYKALTPLAGPAAGLLPVLVYFHGGGWTIGDLDTHDCLCRVGQRLGLRRVVGGLPHGAGAPFPLCRGRRDSCHGLVP